MALNLTKSLLFFKKSNYSIFFSFLTENFLIWKAKYIEKLVHKYVETIQWKNHFSKNIAKLTKYYKFRYLHCPHLKVLMTCHLFLLLHFVNDRKSGFRTLWKRPKRCVEGTSQNILTLVKYCNFVILKVQIWRF